MLKCVSMIRGGGGELFDINEFKQYLLKNIFLSKTKNY